MEKFSTAECPVAPSIQVELPGEEAEASGQRVEVVSLHDEDLELQQSLDVLSHVLQTIRGQIQEDLQEDRGTAGHLQAAWSAFWLVDTYQGLHAVDAAWQMSYEVVAEVELPESGQVGERSWQRGELVVGQTQDLKRK